MTTFTTEDRIQAQATNKRGASEDREMSYQDIANELGVSKTCIQYIERNALEKVRKLLINQHDINSTDDLV